LETTEVRVRDDLLGAGPKTVDELRTVAAKLKIKYEARLSAKEQKAGLPPPPPMSHVAGQMVGNAGTAAVGVFSRIKAASPNLKESLSARLKKGGAAQTVSFEKATSGSEDAPTPPQSTFAAAPDLLTASPSPPKADVFDTGASGADEGVWINHSDADAYVTSAVGHFSIDDDDDDDV
jgi:hypothetical protein